jgi:hypothetical protein
VPAGAYTRLENVAIDQEGAITSRKGLAKYEPSLQTDSFGLPIDSLHYFYSLPTAGAGVVVGAGTNLYVSYGLLDTGFSSEPKAFTDFRPEAYAGSVTYVGTSSPCDTDSDLGCLASFDDTGLHQQWGLDTRWAQRFHHNCRHYQRN